MVRKLAAAILCVCAGPVSAASLTLDMRVDSIGFTNVDVWEDYNSVLLDSYSFVEESDDIWGMERAFSRFSLGDVVTLDLEYDPSSGSISDCSVGGYSCYGSTTFGRLNIDSFVTGDGEGSTDWDDFTFSGGVNIGDTVELGTYISYSPLKYLDPSASGTSRTAPSPQAITWSSDYRYFTVVGSSLAPVPLPASVLFLVAAIGGLGVVRRLSGKEA